MATTRTRGAVPPRDPGGPAGRLRGERVLPRGRERSHRRIGALSPYDAPDRDFNSDGSYGTPLPRTARGAALDVRRSPSSTACGRPESGSTCVGEEWVTPVRSVTPGASRTGVLVKEHARHPCARIPGGRPAGGIESRMMLRRNAVQRRRWRGRSLSATNGVIGGRRSRSRVAGGEWQTDRQPRRGGQGTARV